jgi:type III secretion protein W
MTGNIGDSAASQIIKSMQDIGADTAKEVKQEGQVASAAGLAESLVKATAGLKSAKTEKKSLKDSLKRANQAGKSGDKASHEAQQMFKERAQDFQNRNPELKANVLVLLRNSIKPDDSPEQILKKVRDTYADVSLADEALEYLLLTTEGELHNKVKSAKEDFNNKLGREIAAGRNIAQEAREAAQEGLGTTSSLRDMYRDITGNPRDANTLFNELSNRYTYKALKKVTDFLLHSMGADMKAKGPSIPPGELHNLLTEVRALQAILGVYRFFHGRMPLVKTMMANVDLEVPKELNFENLSKGFMALIAERYPTADKVLQQSKRLGVADSIDGKIVAFSQYRDGVRQVSAQRIYRSIQHRDEVSAAIIEALEGLEDQLEEMLETQENDEPMEQK